MLVILLSAIFLIAGSPVKAQNCDQILVDEAGVLKGDEAMVLASAQRLINAGAEVRVRVIKTIAPSADINQYEADLEKSCSSWRALDGGTRNNLIVIILSMDHESGIYFGSEWRKKLDPKWNDIRANKMNPKLRDGKFAQGLSAAMDEMVSVIEYEPTGVGTIFLWVLGFALAIFLVIYIPIMVARRRREREARNAAQQVAKLARTGCSSLINELGEPLSLLEIKVKDLKTKASAEDIKSVTERFDRLKADLDSFTMEFGNLSHSANDPEKENLSVLEYEAMTETYQGLLEKLTTAKRQLKKVDEDASIFKKQIDAAPGIVSSSDKALSDAEAAIDGIIGQGFKTEKASQILQAARDLRANATTALEKKFFAKAIDLSSLAVAKAEEATEAANDLVAQKADLDQEIADLEAHLAEVDAQIDSGHAIFEEISAQYAESCWKVIQGNGSEAENRVDWTQKAITEVQRLVSMEVQDFTKAEEMINQVNTWLAEAESFMRSVTALKENLEAAKCEAPGEIEAIQKDVESARKYIETYDQDIKDSLETDLVTAQTLLGQARDGLAVPMPDYITIVKLIKQANEVVHNVLTEAEAEHEAAESLRRQAVTSLREAKRSCSAAKEYIEDHSSVVDSEAESLLSKAVDQLDEAEAATDPADIVEYANSADRQADEALESAQNDVRRDEERRREEAARRRREEEERRERTEAAAEERRRRDDDDDNSISIGWGSRSSSPGFGGFGGGGGGSSIHIGGGGGGGSIGISSRGGGGGKW